MTAGERGAALVMTVMIVALVAGLGGALLLVASIETAVQAHHQQAHSVRQAAESGLACAVSDLRRAADWAAVLPGGPPPAGACLEPAVPPPGTSLPGAPALTATLQASTDARYGVSPDTPRWALWVTGSPPPGRSVVPRPVVFVWIADDVEDGDGDAGTDSNDTLWVRAEAWGTAGARVAIEAIVRRGPEADPPAAVVAWRAVR